MAYSLAQKDESSGLPNSEEARDDGLPDAGSLRTEATCRLHLLQMGTSNGSFPHQR